MTAVWDQIFVSDNDHMFEIILQPSKFFICDTCINYAPFVSLYSAWLWIIYSSDPLNRIT